MAWQQLYVHYTGSREVGEDTVDRDIYIYVSDGVCGYA
jgi:hypothetical protein